MFLVTFGPIPMTLSYFRTSTGLQGYTLALILSTAFVGKKILVLLLQHRTGANLSGLTKGIAVIGQGLVMGQIGYQSNLLGCCFEVNCACHKNRFDATTNFDS